MAYAFEPEGFALEKACGSMAALEPGADPYDEFNYVERQRRDKRNADMLEKYCSADL